MNVRKLFVGEPATLEILCKNNVPIISTNIYIPIDSNVFDVKDVRLGSFWALQYNNIEHTWKYRKSKNLLIIGSTIIDLKIAMQNNMRDLINSEPSVMYNIDILPKQEGTMIFEFGGRTELLLTSGEIKIADISAKNLKVMIENRIDISLEIR